jgi:hypothetical protein
MDQTIYRYGTDSVIEKLQYAETNYMQEEPVMVQDKKVKCLFEREATAGTIHRNALGVMGDNP